MTSKATIQIGTTIRTVEIPSAALKPAATTALRAFWATLDSGVRAQLNGNVSRAIAALRAPEHLHSQIAMRVLWGASDLLGIDAQWDAFAAETRWAAIA